jgi:oligosaccharide repeat unit polymerase
LISVGSVARALGTIQIQRGSWGKVAFLCVGALLVALVVVPFVHWQPSEEAAWLFGLWLMWGFGTLWSLSRRSFSPPALGLMAIMLIFAIVPATIAVASGQTVFAGVDYTSGTLAALQISAAAQFGITAGLIIAHRSYGNGGQLRRVAVDVMPRRLKMTGLAIIGVAAIAFVLLTVLSGADLSQYVAILGNASYGAFTRSAIDTPSGYLGSLKAVAGVCLMLAVVARSNSSRRGRPLLITALAVIAAAFLASGGGRGALAVSVLAAGLLWVKVRRSPRRLAMRTLTVVTMCALLVFAGIIGLARGPDHPSITATNLIDEQFGAGSSLFAPLAGLAQTIPAQQNYLFGSSYLEAFYFPIPRAVWPDKPQGAIVRVIGQFSDASNGESFLEYGEMYANFGVAGVVLGCVLFAALLEWMWIRLATSVGGRGLFVYPALIAMMLDVFTRAYAVSEVAGLLGILLGAIGLQRFLNFKVFARSEVGTLERDRPRPQHTSPV